MNHYWTCSKFADWLRGTPKGGAKTSKEWREWENTAKQKPFRYWLADEGLDYLQRFVFFIPDKLHAIKYYINNRFVTRTHCLTAHPRDIKPGDWRDVGYRFLPCLFNELVDYVEVELAWWNIAWSNPEERAKYKAPFWATGWFRWRTWRSPESGLDNLKWQMSITNEEFLDDDKKHLAELTSQAINAKEIYDLYLWWTMERPKRVDPMEASGWSAYCESRWAEGGSIWDQFEDKDNPNKIDTKPMHDIMNEFEAKYEQEDEDMMIRLIKIRQSLWT